MITTYDKETKLCGLKDEEGNWIVSPDFEYIEEIPHYADLTFVESANTKVYKLYEKNSSKSFFCYQANNGELFLSKNKYGPIRYFFNNLTITWDSDGSMVIIDLSENIIQKSKDNTEKELEDFYDYTLSDNSEYFDLLRVHEVITLSEGKNYGYSKRLNEKNGKFAFFSWFESGLIFRHTIAEESCHGVLDMHNNLPDSLEYDFLDDFDYRTGTCLVGREDGKCALINRYFIQITPWYDEALFWDDMKKITDQNISFDFWNNHFAFLDDEDLVFVKLEGNLVEDMMKRPHVFYSDHKLAKELIFDPNAILDWEYKDNISRIHFDTNNHISNDDYLLFQESRDYVDNLMEIDNLVSIHQKSFGILPSGYTEAKRIKPNKGD